jgi:predicted alpha/beta superfamily hydrolase
MTARKFQTQGSRLSYPPEITAQLAQAGPGQLHKYENYRSRFLPGERAVVVYIPGIYEKRPDLRFPVLYMQDGQNLFDRATSFGGVHWRLGETADELIFRGEIQPLIIVGIYNTGKRRIREYTPSRAKKLGGGSADRYGRMLVREIKPFIESRYRTLGGPEHTGLGGSSLGGLLTIYLGLRFPKIFGRLAVLSPSVWWNGRWIVKYAAGTKLNARPRIWLDVGTQEAAHTADDARALRDALTEKGWRHVHDLHYEEIEGGQHNEAAWAQRVGPFLRFLFPPDRRAV